MVEYGAIRILPNSIIMRRAYSTLHLPRRDIMSYAGAAGSAALLGGMMI
uniref:Uncharacterized protein n=1 Tax=Candidatus Kentrum sp. UNK TaxID=2126344 RepID=A0A451AY36_9GAMM|nr:MAG: hypothetical protein BECKUNK1418G_GA0071005_11811 [Candidatus Kentron sp. UNK]VFK70954.1 MAG: hypothetical protein BECKUNK1418H_GA0071006_10453 [Candidatus Kentron sp. UNK]